LRRVFLNLRDCLIPNQTCRCIVRLRIIVLAVVAAMLASLAQAQSRARGRAAHPAQKTIAGEPSGRTLPIRRVILYSNGVAYFERRGPVSGRAEVDLSFKQSQVDDVLKSIIVLDLGRGRVGAVSYNSSQPPSARLSDIPFSIEPGTDVGAGQMGGLAAVLRQLQGARVTVTTASRTASGSILTVEERRSQIDANKPPLITHTLVIASEAGELISFELSEVRAVRLLDEGTRHDIAEFASASASARRRDAKTIVVTSEGAEQREMLVSYTVAAPIWKTTYRVVLDEAGKPFFQGWAIVDNVGEEDWSAVDLSLVSGTPVSFIHQIQQPLYRYRPVIPIPPDLNVDPQTYEPTEGVEGGVAGGVVGGVAGGAPGGVMARRARAADAAEMAPSPPPAAGPATSLSDLITSEDAGVKAAATGSEVGDLFEYRIDQPVTVRRDRSALIPILQTRMEGERVSIYNEAARADRPMSGLRLKNTSPLTLEGGSLTVIDGNAYAGEALMERLKPGEDRFISFALDLGTLVTARSKEDRAPAFLVRIVNGVFQAHYYRVRQKTYTLTNQTERPRVVFVEHPAQDRWALSDDAAKPFEKTAGYYRFRVELGPRATVELPVSERLALMDAYALSNLTPKDLSAFVSSNYVDAQTRAALEKIIEIKGRAAAVSAQIEALDKEQQQIAEDQARLRENIKALGETAEARQLIARYVAKAGEQETRLEQIAAERRLANSEAARLQAELEAAIRALALDRKL
jgi:hypothetical protein